MTEIIEAIFDGMVFRPLEPLDLPPNTRVTLTVSESGLKLEDMAVLLGATDQLDSEAPDTAGKSSDDMGDLEK